MALSEKQIDYSGNSNTSMEQLFLANEKDLYIASRSLKAMGHPLRLKILCILAEGTETSVQDLVDRQGHPGITKRCQQSLLPDRRRQDPGFDGDHARGFLQRPLIG